MEKWKPIAGYESSYEISNLGRVRSKDRKVSFKRSQREVKGCVKSLSKDRGGYLYVDLYKNGIVSRQLVHRLVAEAFISQKPNHNVVHHKDHDRSNNTVENLEWVTNDYNLVEAAIHNSKEHTYKDSHNKFKTHKCLDCGHPIQYKSKWCRSCAVKHTTHHYKRTKLSKTEVKDSLMKFNGNFTQAAKRFDMTDNSLRKWCKKYDLPTHSKEWKRSLGEKV
ncbi:NUMOD4 motif-containing HNH endonuclease [Limosilactobacillus reuteri]|uniref:NUMOD4 motif-containing HNH endonuclease n=1 Tax=Limosilactobacillus reuteri TaxID=1598 RepID=UPI001E517CB2|nr:NUMOD4 motif-containing HNH endonuclease [Limosilactobacillus reuteri]MCC4427877.1 NUMOD4 motif-containing HNH endonuclease [Limosilactobacillus reuteri]MCC4431597.1 NUMOD4 motif-containing HNH endonuclease [Limosilactobacillus reuteri]MCC4433872.1 NUMOD4 motif-containing HNH endonuclease [Limosilactobacillus reuteri]MDY2688869.1 NUMOD4 motif-containing HNH endonuclease [Limosilactobacillus reuteri]